MVTMMVTFELDEIQSTILAKCFHVSVFIHIENHQRFTAYLFIIIFCSIMSQLYSIPQRLQCILHKMQIVIRSIKELFEFRPEKQTTNMLHGVNVIRSKMQMYILIDQDFI